MGREGFEPTKAEPAILQTAPFGHLGTCPYATHYTHPSPKCQPSARRLLKNKSENSDLGGQFGVVMTEYGDAQGGDSHGKGALQEAAGGFILWRLDL